MSCGMGDVLLCVVVVPTAGPISCSEAAAVPLDPSTIVASDWGGPRTNAPLAGTVEPASPGFALPGEPSPVQKW